MLNLTPVFAAALLASAQHSPEVAPKGEYISEGPCAAIVRVGEKFTWNILDEFHALEATLAPYSTIAPQMPADTVAILCTRSTMVPAPFDYRIILAGYPFYIGSINDDPQRMGILERSGGAFRYRMVAGELTQAEQAGVAERLNYFQTQAPKEEMPQQATSD